MFIGIDPSLSGTAVACYGGEVVRLSSENEGNDVRSRMRRYRKLADDAVFEIASQHKQPSQEQLTIFIEGYSYGSKGSSFLTLAEYGAILRSKLTISFPQATIVEIPPSTLKKFITGVGKGKKTGLIGAIASKYGVTFESDDEYDAFGLALMAAAYGGEFEMTNNTQREVIEQLRRAPIYLTHQKAKR